MVYCTLKIAQMIIVVMVCGYLKYLYKKVLLYFLNTLFMFKYKSKHMHK